MRLCRCINERVRTCKGDPAAFVYAHKCTGENAWRRVTLASYGERGIERGTYRAATAAATAAAAVATAATAAWREERAPLIGGVPPVSDRDTSCPCRRLRAYHAKDRCCLVPRVCLSSFLLKFGKEESEASVRASVALHPGKAASAHGPSQRER